MRSRLWFRTLCLIGAASLGVCALAAGPQPRDYVSRLDGALASATGPDGRVWSVWAYRAAGEYDIAIAVRGANDSWSQTTFLGRRDRIDQLEPAIAVDAAGNVYLAFATRSPQRIWTSVLPAGGAMWSEPVAIALGEAASAPALRILRDRLVIGYRSAGGIRIIDVPLYVTPNASTGIQDGPDSNGPLGNDGRDLPSGDDDPPPPSDEEDESSNS